MMMIGMYGNLGLQLAFLVGMEQVDAYDYPREGLRLHEFSQCIFVKNLGFPAQQR